MFSEKKILVLNCGQQINFYIRNERSESVSFLLQVASGNTGNFVFKESVIKELGHLNCVDSPWFSVQPNEIQYINDNFKCVVCPCANAFRHDVPYLNYLSKKLDGITIPIVIMGIGAEDDLDLNCDNDIQTIESLKNLSSRSIIGTRGEFTTKVLEKYGITNTMTIGCPSLFSPCSKKFCVSSVNGTSNKIALNTEFGHDTWSPLYYGNLEQFSYFPQNETEELFMQKDQTFNVSDERRQIVKKLVNERLFPNMEVWIHEMKKCRFSVGPRFHGNVVALLAGIPALFVKHCCRVNEMIDFFGLPSVTIDEYFRILKENNNDLQIFEQYLNYSRFNERYPALYENFSLFLKMNDLGGV